MPCQRKLAIMHRQSCTGSNLSNCQRRLFREHMNLCPILIVLAILHQSEIKTTSPGKPSANILEMSTIAAIPAAIDIIRWCQECKSTPFGLVPRQRTTGKMLRRQHMHWEILCQPDLIIPVALVNLIGPKSPFPQVAAHAQRADKQLDLILHGQECRIVEMIPMIMGNCYQVDLRKICRLIDIRTRKCTVHEKDRRRIIRKHRIDQDAPSAQLQIKTWVAQPDHQILIQWKAAQICLHTGQRVLRGPARLITKQELPGGWPGTFLTSHHLYRLQTDKLPILVMWRLLHPPQIIPLWILPKSLPWIAVKCTSCQRPRQRQSA